MPSLSILLAQFQSRYPMANLISELSTIHQDSYVVRAVVRVGNTILATGLAAAQDVEAAEDRAKLRALEALGMLISDTPNPAAPINTGLPLSQPPAPSRFNNQWSAIPLPDDSVSQDAIAPDLETTLPAVSSKTPGAVAALEVEGLAPLPNPMASVATPPEKMEPPSIVADLYAHITEDEGSSLEVDSEPIDLSKIMMPASQLVGKTPRRKAEPISEPEPTPSPEPELPPATLDFSDILAQTDVELRRLTWDAKKGREYLKKTYSKRSRAELSETELYDFLDYLKAQPSPAQSPF